MVAGLPRSGPGMSVQKQYGTCRTVREGVVPPPSPREEPDNRIDMSTVTGAWARGQYEQQQVATDVHKSTSATAGLPQLFLSRKMPSREEAGRAAKSAELRDDLYTDRFSHLWQGRPDRLYVKTMSCEFVLTENMEGATSCATARSRASALTVDGPRVSA